MLGGSADSIEDKERMMAHPTGDDLAVSPLLADLSADVRGRLAQRFEVEEHAAGTRLVSEGASGYAFYVLAEGDVDVTVDGASVRTLTTGDFFGEIAILGEGRRTASVTATTDVRVLRLFGTDFRLLQQEQPDVADSLVAAMRERRGSA
jgi:CRP-like cAMP-binding protein